MNQVVDTTLEKPVVIPAEAYISEAYARAEADKLWGKVWQPACRVEEIPKVGDYVTYDILDESIIVVRTAKDTIQAFYNVCQHRGRRLTEGCGHTAQFYCRFHGWRWDINGENAFVLDPEDWQGVLNADNLRLKSVKADTWSGWVYINMDPDCEPLKDFLRPATPMLDAYELENMRYRWRMSLYFPCNWKTALEAFSESYHVDATHPQMLRYGENKWWSRAEGKHGWHGMGPPRDGATSSRAGGGMNAIRAVAGADARVMVYEQLAELMDTVNATTTDTFVEAARRLKEELPEDTPPEQISLHLMDSAKRIDAERGVFWPEIDPNDVLAAGHDWHIFPNTIVLPGVTFALCYRARPNGYDPNSCLFEAYVIERFPEGQEPKTEWVHEQDQSRWPVLFSQDFQNMPQVQRGMHSRGYVGARPSPLQEAAVTNFHRTLAEYMGTGAPKPIG